MGVKESPPPPIPVQNLFSQLLAELSIKLVQAHRLHRAP